MVDLLVLSGDRLPPVGRVVSLTGQHAPVPPPSPDSLPGGAVGETSRSAGVRVTAATFGPVVPGARLGVVLSIDRSIVDAIVAHARRDHPDEACGVVAGSAGSDTPTRHIPMENAARSMTFYEFDSMEQLRVWREMDDRDEEPVVIYHSHTATEAYPSRTDVSFAGEPGAHYLLVSTREPDTEEIRSFRIVDGVVTEEQVRIVDATVDPHAVQSYMFGQSPATVDYECSDR
jgi:proteasome lid subunit RPN8/RPN11